MNLRWISGTFVGAWWVLALIGYSQFPEQFTLSVWVSAILTSFIVIMICEMGNDVVEG